jgi:segregation and condensation protein B
MSTASLKSIVETILFASEKPLNAGELLKVINRAKGEMAENQKSDIDPETAEAIDVTQETEGESFAEMEVSAEDQLVQAQKEEEGKLSRSEIQQIIDELVEEYSANPDRGFVLVNVAQGFQFRTRQELAPYLKAMNKVGPTRLSQAAMEVLAIVAYRQPLIRAEIDQIRGVDSGGVLKTLMDRELIRIVGKKDEPGKPILYGTADSFLEVFNLRSLQDLPTLKDLAQIEEEMKQKSAGEGESVVLEEDFFETEGEEVASLPNFAERFEQLEKEEEEALDDLENDLRELKNLDEKVITTLHPEKAREEEPLPSATEPNAPSTETPQ